jgi:hypothetical protein
MCYKGTELGKTGCSFRKAKYAQEAKHMTKLKLLAAQYANPTTLRMAFLLLAILAMALAAGAPDALGGGGH